MINPFFPFPLLFKNTGDVILFIKKISIVCEELSPHFNKSASAISISQKPKYRFVAELSRETPSSENQGSNFYDRFAVVDRKTSRPSKIISIRIPDVFVAVMRMKLWPSDTGSSLNFVIRSPIMEVRKLNNPF